ncbi:DUF3592 domain-containing protein [Streptomyces sparsogenes]|uniref:DUF3592 domain-containing protein n=1 Tax=Streptomyces sparsogenes TaxID=67365 RepID=UPI0033DAE669
MGHVFFLAIPALIGYGTVYAMVKVSRRARLIRAMWGSGFTAQARCLRMYTTVHRHSNNSNTTTTRLHHVYEFLAPDGRPVRFEETGGPGTRVEGDIVTVYYLPDRPQQATALEPGDRSVRFGTGCALAFLCLPLLVAAGLLVVYVTTFM